MIRKKLAAILVLIFLIFLVQGSTPADVLSVNTSSKKGVAGEKAPDLTKIGVSWAYTWYICRECFARPGYQHIPMIPEGNYNAAVVTQAARERLGSYWLIWNEPNYWRQADLSPTEAAQIYRNLRPLIKNADPTAKLIVGGVLWLDTGWLGNFRSEYHRLYNEWPVVEGWHVHQYVGATEYGEGKTITSAEWRRRLEAVHAWMDNPNNGGPVELWLTEYGCLNSEAVAYQVMQDQTPWLEAQSWLTRYAWYATWSDDPACLNCTGALFTTVAPYDLTRLGQYYASVGQPSTPTPTSTPINTPTPTSIPGPTPTMTPTPTPTARPTPTPTLIPIPTLTSPPSVCPWDIVKTPESTNGKVDNDDLTKLNSCYDPFGFPNAYCQNADLNQDNVVNALDYSILLTHWGPCPAQ